MKELFVSAAARGRGVGRALMRDLVRIARAESCSRIDWTTDEGNAGARGFYAGLGVPELAEKRFFRVEAAGFGALERRLDGPA